MLNYYFMLGLRSLKRNPVLTALMVLTLAIGVAASVSTLTILHVMSGDPIPQKSDRLITTILDNGPIEGYVAGDKNIDHQLSYKDVMNLLASKQGVRRTALYGISAVIEPEHKELGALALEGFAVTADFFAMLDMPFLYGQSWQASDDKNATDVVVLSEKMAEKLFGTVNPVGKKIRMNNAEYIVSGVFHNWKIQPRFYSYNGSENAFSEFEDMFIPLSNAFRHQTSHSGSMRCSASRAPGWQGLMDSECTWLHFWFELKSPSERQQLHDYLNSYVSEQNKLGRFQRKAPSRTFNVTEFLVEMRLIGDDNKLSAWLAFGFLLLCLVNTIGLLLAKFSVRASEVGVRRALGASRREVFTQFLIESAVIGMAGALLGIVLAFVSLQLIGMQSKSLASVAHMDLAMLALTVLMSVTAAVLAGIIPTWRACQITPAMQLKSQ